MLQVVLTFTFKNDNSVNSKMQTSIGAAKCHSCLEVECLHVNTYTNGTAGALQRDEVGIGVVSVNTLDISAITLL